MILTQNEKGVLRLLATSIGKHLSINDIGKACGLSSGGAFKILAKLENEGILKSIAIANIKAYTLNFEHEKTIRVLELAFIPDRLEGKIKMRADDLHHLKKLTKACVLFGSYITPKQMPGDLDALFLVEKKNFAAYKGVLAKVQDIVPVKIQDVVQTPDDFEKNLKKRDPIITSALLQGIALWGFDVLVRGVKNASR